jgi:fluoride ion exporter CrcB/FEX
MPFTPYHMGPGLLVKAVLRSTFSLMIFGWAQILTDIEPLIAITTGWGRLHGLSHSYLGATILALVAAWTGKLFLGLALDAVRIQDVPNAISWRAAVISGFIGTYSHVLLDSIMHFDVEPFAPISQWSPLIRIISVPALHAFCIYSGVLGATAFLIVGGLIMLKRARRRC